MVTGAGGSIGSELVLQIAASRPASLIMVEHSEFNLYEIEATLSNSNLALDRHALLADVRDQSTMRCIFRKHLPEMVFHAAALKHVPLLENEHNLIEAVRTNVVGTKIVADLCCVYGSDFILVSTDKAVNPSSGMGLTKRVAEVYVHALSKRYPEVRLGQVRFGNVLGSSGSVVPLFRRQIAQGGPVTITDPEMTRYLMTIKEAVGLTLSAADIQQDEAGYSCYVLDMGEPVKIIDLAKQLIRQSGLRPGKDIALQIIGIRPGEKLHEELSYAWEKLEETEVEGVRRARPQFDPLKLSAHIEHLLYAAKARDGAGVCNAVAMIVPEFKGSVGY
jgi:O-antigen biosynthesis protein WbqV